MNIIKSCLLVENFTIGEFSEASASEIRKFLNDPEVNVINTADQVRYLVTESHSQDTAERLINKEYTGKEILKLHWDPVLNMYIIHGDCSFNTGLSAVCIAVYTAYRNLRTTSDQLKYLEILGYDLQKKEQS